MRRKFIDLVLPVKLAELFDGEGYQVPHLKLGQPNLFTRIGSIGNFVVKVPSKRGWGDFSKYVKNEESDPEDIRFNEELERFINLRKAIQRFPEFEKTLDSFGDDVAHFLLVYRLQHERIRNANLIGFPNARFIVLVWPRWLFGKHSMPAIVQQRIQGVRLFDMVEPMEGVFLSQYSHLKTKIRHQLEKLVDSVIHKHIDWNIANFILEEGTNKLFYVDSKPSTLAAKWTVEHNLSSIREVFL